jgi:Tol biopolymer transport system component
MSELLVSRSSSISADGQRIAFATEATLEGVDGPAVVPAVYDRTTGSTTLLTPTGTAADALYGGSPIEISANGRRILWSRVGSGGAEITRVDFV